jgi:hypothetical protein
MENFTEDAIDRADALKLAASICKRDALELFALAETNPQLLAEWLDELTRCRHGAQDEVDRLTAAVDYLRIARRATFASDCGTDSLVRSSSCVRGSDGEMLEFFPAPFAKRKRTVRSSARLG